MIFVRCRKAVALWSESLDHPLPPSARFAAWLHCLLCHSCRRYTAQVLALRKGAKELLKDGEPKESRPEAEGLSEERRRKISEALGEAQRKE